MTPNTNTTFGAAVNRFWWEAINSTGEGTEDFHREAAILVAAHNADKAKSLEEFVHQMFPEYDGITNPSYSFIVNKSELDQALSLMENK